MATEDEIKAMRKDLWKMYSIIYEQLHNFQTELVNRVVG